MKLKTKKGKMIDIKVTEENGAFNITSFDNNAQKLGFLNFKLLNKNEVWLYQVATYEDFRNQGIASSMLEVMEYITAVMQDRIKVRGKFSPTSFYAENFYKKNGYSIIIYNSCYPIVEKILDKEKIKTSFEEKTHKEPIKIISKKTEIKKIVESEIKKSTKLKQEFLN